MKKQSGSKIKVYREWNDKKPFKATLGKKIPNKGKHGNYDDVYMATIEGEDKEIKVAYGELSKMEPPRDVWFMVNSSELNKINQPSNTTSMNEGKLPAEDELKRLGIKYELSGNKYKPFKKIFKPTDKSDKFYKEFDDVIWRYNLSSAVESVNEVKIKKQIREEIIRILSEGMTADEWVDAQEEARPLSEEEIDAIYDNFIDTNKYKETVIDDPDGTKENAILKIDTPDGKSYKVLTNAEDDEKWWKWGDIREEEMTDAEMEKKAEKEAKSKEAEKISDVKDDLAKQQKMLKKVKDVMKDRAKDYKKAEGKEKDNIKIELKALTSGKKQIEAKIKKLDKQL